jgi:DNA-binding NarL/FixJ family response regulator
MIRVLIVDDESLVRSGLRLILEASDDILVVAEARDGAEALEIVGRQPIDVILMDVRMPGVDGLTAASELAQFPDPPKIIMLTTFDQDDYVQAALRAGAVGFLLKDTPPQALIESVRTVAEGNAMLSPTVTRRLINSLTDIGAPQADRARSRLAILTEREHDVIVAVASGLSNAEIARKLDMAESTVKAHVSHLLAKLDMHNRVQAAILVHDARLA